MYTHKYVCKYVCAQITFHRYMSGKTQFREMKLTLLYVKIV